MKKVLLWVLPVLLLCGAPMNAMAVTEASGTEVTIKLEDLPDHMVNSVMTAKKKSDELAASGAANTANSVVEVVKTTNPAELKAWLDVVGEALTGFCTTIGMGVNEFIKTPVGMLIAGLAILNYGGMEILSVISGLILSFAVWVIFTCIWVWSYRRSHFKRMWKPFWPWNSTPPVEIEPAYSDEDKRGASMVIHIVVWFIVSLSCSLGAFANW